MKILSKEQVEAQLSSIQRDCKNDIFLDMEDIELITKDKDSVMIGVCENKSNNSSSKIITSIINDFENNRPPLTKLDGILVYFQVHSKYDTCMMLDAMEIVYNKYDNQSIDNQIYILFGTYCNDKLDIDYAKVTVFFALSKE